MTILEFVVAINAGITDRSRRFYVDLVSSAGGRLTATLMTRTLDANGLVLERQELGSVQLYADDGLVQSVILLQSAPVRVLRHLERHVPEVPVK